MLPYNHSSAISYLLRDIEDNFCPEAGLKFAPDRGLPTTFTTNSELCLIQIQRKASLCLCGCRHGPRFEEGDTLSCSWPNIPRRERLACSIEKALPQGKLALRFRVK